MSCDILQFLPKLTCNYLYCTFWRWFDICDRILTESKVCYQNNSRNKEVVTLVCLSKTCWKYSPINDFTRNYQLGLQCL